MSTIKTTIQLTTGGGTLRAVNAFLSGVVSRFYLIRVIHQNRQYAITRYWDSQQILENINFMNKKNTQGFNIYCRPADPMFVMLDDLIRENLIHLATLRPCALIETSPGNYQAWLKIERMPQARDLQKAVWQTLAHMMDSDMKSAKPDQIGRLPGFLNMKPAYFPNHPLVVIHKFTDRSSTWQPDSLPQPETNNHIPPPVVKRKGNADRSAFDWAVACDLVKKGWTDDQIRIYLEKRSLKAAGRRDDYLGRTILSARRRLNIYV